MLVTVEKKVLILRVHPNDVFEEYDLVCTATLTHFETIAEICGMVGKLDDHRKELMREKLKELGVKTVQFERRKRGILRFIEWTVDPVVVITIVTSIAALVAIKKLLAV